MEGGALLEQIEQTVRRYLAVEADTFLGDSEGLRGILNSGHMKGQAYVTRVVGDDFQVCMFSTWTAKAVALIGDLPGTLADRAITIRMRRRAHSERIERLQLHRLAEMEDLRSMASRWAQDHMEALRFADPETSPGIGRGTTGDLFSPSPTKHGRNGPGGRGRAPAACLNRPPRRSPLASPSWRI